MARRKQGILEDIVELATALPWWAGLGIAGVAYLVLHGFANVQITPTGNPGEILHSADKIVWKAFARIFQYLIPLAFLLGAVASGVNRAKRKNLLSKAANPQQGRAIEEMTWQEFEMLVGEAFRQQNYAVTEMGLGGADGGIDLVLHRGGLKYLVQCKHWKVRQVGVKPVREFYGVMASAQAAGGFFVTSGHFSEEAMAFAKGKNIDLIDSAGVYNLVRKVRTPPTMVTSQLEFSRPLCPKCGAEMVLRKARKGRHAGQEFWGCSIFPKCRFTQTVGAPDMGRRCSGLHTGS